MLVYGLDVDALVWCEVYVPVVLWYASEDMLAGEGPGGWYVGVLDPDVLVVLGECEVDDGVLGEECGVLFDVFLYD